jgi:hypothetical protein
MVSHDGMLLKITRAATTTAISTNRFAVSSMVEAGQMNQPRRQKVNQREKEEWRPEYSWGKSIDMGRVDLP